jgi:hypothetical protein
MGYLRPIPRRLLPDDILVFPSDGAGGFADCKMVRHVCFVRAEDVVDGDPHRDAAVTGKVYVDAVNSKGGLRDSRGLQGAGERGAAHDGALVQALLRGARAGAPLGAGGGLIATEKKSEIPNEMRVVRDALRSLGYANAYDVPVSPRACCEPIVVSMTDWERETLQADGSERGRRNLTAHVICDDWADARMTSREVARQLREYDWAHATTPERMRIVACDIAQPICYGRDLSGRWIYDVAMMMTVVIEHE